MSRVHKVIILNKPFKIADFTISQILLFGLVIVVGLFTASQVPQAWKVGHLPANFLVGLGFVCLGLVGVKFTDLKPMVWWKNMVLYKLKLVPTQFIPKPEEAQIYPDPTIIEARKKSDDFYIGSES